MDESGFEQVPTIAYGINLLLAALAYYTLQLAIFAGASGPRLKAALGRDLKGKLSPLMYLTGIALSFVVVGPRRGGVRARRPGLAGAGPAGGALPGPREPGADVSADRVEPYGGEEYVVRRITGSASTKPYRCPGCHQVDPARDAAHRRVAGAAVLVRA